MTKGHGKKIQEKTISKKHSSHNKVHDHPDHTKELIKLKRAKGQIDGVIGMIEENRYCPDILIQIRAAKSALQSVEHSILKTHLGHCVHDVLQSKDVEAASSKIDELIEMIGRHI